MGFLLEKLVKNEKLATGHGNIYALNSVWHGSKISLHTKERLAKEQVERLTDFIDYLFDHSEHCDHISQSDAWKEFEQFEMKRFITERKTSLKN